MIDLVQRSTIHGVNHIYSSKSKIVKVLWLLLFLFGIAGISVNIFFVLRKYISNPVLFSHTLDYERFTWPDLTFCTPTAPFNLAGNPKVYEYWKQMSDQLTETTKMLINESNIFDIIRESSQTDSEIEERTITMSSTDPQKLELKNSSRQFIYTGYSSAHEGMFFNDEFEGKDPSKVSQDLSTMFTTQIIQLGNNIPCHTFHIYHSKKINQNKVQSLVFILKFDYESSKIFNSSYLHRSIIAFISNRGEIPKHPIILVPGYYTSIKVTQSRHTHHNYKRPCRKEMFKVELYDALLQSTKEFEGDMNDCKKIVSQELFVENCGCYSPFLPIYKNQSGFPRICLNATRFTKLDLVKNAKCLFQVYEKNKEKSVFDKIMAKKCLKYKPIKCEMLNYKTYQRKEMFVELWSDEYNDRRRHQLKMIYKNLFKVKADENYKKILRDNIIELQIERDNDFGDLYTESREYPFSELLSDIGGLMGLWLGMSVVGLFEIAEYFYLYIKDQFNMRRQGNEKPSEEDFCNKE